MNRKTIYGLLWFSPVIILGLLGFIVRICEIISAGGGLFLLVFCIILAMAYKGAFLLINQEII